MHIKSDNIGIMVDKDTDKIIQELFDPLLRKYHTVIEPIESSNFVIDYVDEMYYKCHKTNINRRDHT